MLSFAKPKLETDKVAKEKTPILEVKPEPVAEEVTTGVTQEPVVQAAAEVPLTPRSARSKPQIVMQDAPVVEEKMPPLSPRTLAEMEAGKASIASR